MRRIVGLLLLMTLLTGCALRPACGETPPAESGGIMPALLDPSAPEEEQEISPLVEEEILTAYQRAVSAWSWFERTPLPHTGEPVEVDGTAYWQVDSVQVADFDDLRLHLRRLFTEELTEELLATGGESPLYLEWEDRLYVRPGGRERDLSRGSQQAQVEKISDTAYSVNVTVDLLDEDSETVVGVEFWTFPYELVEDRWVFTAFRLID